MTRIALVHDWLAAYAGSERVVEQLLAVFPQADVFTLVDALAERDRHFLGGRVPRTSFIQRLPFARRIFRHYLPLMPLAIEQFDLRGYDLVISSSHAIAKGVITGPDQVHVCYCHSPMRYAWDLQGQYLAESGMDRGLKACLGWLVVRPFLHYLRIWDCRTAHQVDRFAANSAYIGRRIGKCYGRTSTVIHPPVDVQAFQPGGERGQCYVTASRMVPYKRMPLIVEAFNRMPERRLVVIGDGPDFARVKAIAKGNITVLGYQPSAALLQHLQSARGFVFAAEEDFGILPVEAMACGTPVIAYGRGGAAETVVDGVSGVLFQEQTPEAICAAVERSEQRVWDPAACRRQAERFSVERFRDEFTRFVDQALAERSRRP